MATPNLQALVSVEHPVKPPLKQASGSCAFRTGNLRQSGNSYQQKQSGSKSCFMCQLLIGNIEAAICSEVGKKPSATQSQSCHFPCPVGSLGLVVKGDPVREVKNIAN